MKTKIIESLKKRVLLVNNNLPEGILSAKIENDGCIEIEYKEGKKSFFAQINPEDNWQLLSTLKDISEEQCDPLVKVSDEGFECWDYSKNEWGYFGFDPYLSFLSALEAENVLFENPMGDTIPELDEDDLWDVDEQDSQVIAQLNYDIEKWQEAEQNVFSKNTLIFVEG